MGVSSTARSGTNSKNPYWSSSLSGRRPPTRKAARPLTLLDNSANYRDTTRQAVEQILIRAADEQRDHTPDELAEHRYYTHKIIDSTFHDHQCPAALIIAPRAQGLALALGSLALVRAVFGVVITLPD